MICIYQNHPKSHASYPFSGEIAIIPEPELRAFWVDWRNSPHAIARCPAMGKLSRIPHDFCQWWFRQNADKSSKLPDFLLSKKQRIKFKVAPDLNWRNITNHKHWTKSQISSAAARFQWGFYKKHILLFQGVGSLFWHSYFPYFTLLFQRGVVIWGVKFVWYKNLAKLYIYI